MQKQLSVSSKSKNLQTGVKLDNAHAPNGLKRTNVEKEVKVTIVDRQRVSAQSLKKRLKDARERNRQLEKAGKLPNPTKKWSAKSVQTLSEALSGK